MQDIFLRATPVTPEVDFRCDGRIFALRGESYPENAAAFYAPLIEQASTCLERLHAGEVRVEVALTYFNSASTKMLFRLFQVFDRAAEAGNAVTVAWRFDEDDDTIREFGEDLQEEYSRLGFKPMPQTG